MTNKDNFNKAVYDLFGLGNDAASEGGNPTAVPEPQVESHAVPVEEGLVTPHAVPVAPSYASAVPAQSFVLMPATYIAPGTVVEGNISSKSDVEVAGKITGSIVSDGDVTIRSDMNGDITSNNLYLDNCKLVGDAHCCGNLHVSEHSKITGNVYVKELVCAGQINGDLDVDEFTTLESTAIIEGNIYSEAMTMERGAILKGTLTMGARKDKKPSPTKKAAQTV